MLTCNIDLDKLNAARAVIKRRYGNNAPLAHVRCYGCAGSFADGDRIKGVLALVGYSFCDKPDGADLVVYNTCAVREHAQQRVFGNIGALSHAKKKKGDMIIAVTGCMSQQQSVQEKIRRTYPFIDIILGTSSIGALPDAISDVLTHKSKRVMSNDALDVIEEGLPARRDNTIRTSVPISYGCNNYCSYCIVPYVRGSERSRDSKDVISEVRELVNGGYKEITLLGQNVNSYGNDRPGELNFSTLLRVLNDIDGDFWIRFMTSHPKDFTEELVDTMKHCDKVCKSLHLPVQSGSDRILELMNRKYTSGGYIDKINRLRSEIPHISVTSDVIVGFPGETEEDFAATLELVKKAKFSSMFTFIYSRREGTKSCEMEDATPREEKLLRFDRLLKLQSELSIKKHESLVGSVQRVLCESSNRPKDGYISGKTEENILTEFLGGDDLTGGFVNVRITGAQLSSISGEIEDSL